MKENGEENPGHLTDKKNFSIYNKIKKRKYSY